MTSKRKSTDPCTSPEPRRSKRSIFSALEISSTAAKSASNGKKPESESHVVAVAAEANVDPEQSPGRAKASARSNTERMEIGDTLPDMSLQTHESIPISLLAEARDHGIVLFSYPAASTPGCTSQACSYRDRYSDISKNGYKVYGISTDSVKAQEKFRTKQGFQYPLLSDPKKELLSMLGGSTSAKKTALRCHWIFSKGGVLEARELNVKPRDCVSKALQSIDEIELRAACSQVHGVQLDI